MIVLIYSGTYLLKSTAKPMLTFFHSTYGVPLHGDFMSRSLSTLSSISHSSVGSALHVLQSASAQSQKAHAGGVLALAPVLQMVWAVRAEAL